MPHFDYKSPEIQYLSDRDKHLGRVIQMIGPLDYELVPDGYAFLVGQIIEQMLSKKVATVLTTRLTATCESNTITPAAMDTLSDQDIHALGIARTKVHYLRNLTTAVTSGQLDFDQLATLTNPVIIKKLTAIKGVGQWTAKMVLIFVLDRRDVLPYEDVAFLQGYRWVYKTTITTPATVQKKCRKWRPASTIAARYLYLARDRGLTKQPFHLFK